LAAWTAPSLPQSRREISADLSVERVCPTLSGNSDQGFLAATTAFLIHQLHDIDLGSIWRRCRARSAVGPFWVPKRTPRCERAGSLGGKASLI
jgi:hypothetical protein